jgi:hypothetical protein
MPPDARADMEPRMVPRSVLFCFNRFSLFDSELILHMISRVREAGKGWIGSAVQRVPRG